MSYPMRPSLLLALLLPLLPACALAEHPRLRICYESDDAMPFWTDAQQAKPGLLVELIQAAAQQADLRLEFQRQPWKRCVMQLQSGQSDGIFAAIWQADRDVWGQFPGRDPERQEAVDRDYRLWQVDYPIIISTDSLLQWNGQQFKGLQYGLSAPLGYIASQRLQAHRLADGPVRRRRQHDILIVEEGVADDAQADMAIQRVLAGESGKGREQILSQLHEQCPVHQPDLWPGF